MTALSPRRSFSFSGNALKTIACITMLVGHIGASCIEAGILTPGLNACTLSQDTLSTYPLYRLDMVLRFTATRSKRVSPTIDTLSMPILASSCRERSSCI